MPPPSDYAPATRPTMYFIGVTTRQSSINQVFPLWAERLQLGGCELRGMDFPLRANPAEYRAAVEFMRDDPLSLGALVTSHKLDVFSACADQFAFIDDLSRSLGEISSIFKRDGRLHGRTVDPWTSGYALNAFVPADEWGSEVEFLILGAGGAGAALTWHLSHRQGSATPPKAIHLADRIPGRIEEVQRLHRSWRTSVPLVPHHVETARDADEILARLPPGSFVVNATGAGKDTPGSPLTDAAVFPERAKVWEFNYRGELRFLEQARAQQRSRHLRITDGWMYFLHGWTRVMADVFDREIPTEGALFDELGQIAARVAGRV